MPIKTLFPHLLLFFANLFFAINFTVAKDIMPFYIQPFAFIVLRVSAAAILFEIYFRLVVRQPIEKSDVTRLILCSLFGVTINQLLFFKGLNWSNAINPALIMTTTPIAVVVASYFILKEKITSLKIGGVLIGMSGALLILLYGKQISWTSETFLGDLLVFLNAISYAIYMVLVKPLLQKYESVTVMRWIFWFGLIGVLPIGFSELIAIDFTSFSPSVWLKLSYVLFFVTFLAYLFNALALKKVTSAVASTYIYLQPLLATIIAILFRGDEFNWVKLTAGICIFTGVYMVSRTQKN